MNSYTQEQQELVDLLSNELADFVESSTSDFGDVEKQGASKAQLKDCRSHSESIGNAAELVGLGGLADCCRCLNNNFEKMIEVSSSLSTDQILLAQSWSIYLLAYLQCLGKEGVNSTIDELIEFLQDGAWLEPLSATQAESMLLRFSQSTVCVDDHFKDELPTIVDEQMVSLSIDDDVRPELIEGLLLELPSQIQDFVNSVVAYIDNPQISYVETAQRIAHTIKGAANVVNVRGIANLMHYTEEILQSAAKDEQTYPAIFATHMLEVSDCLEAMGECLLGIGEYPENAADVIQSLLDRCHGADVKDGPALPASTNLPKIDSVAASHGDDGSASASGDTSSNRALKEKANAHLRVPEPLVKELLRIAGENIISNTRAQSQTKQLQSNLTQLSDYHQQLRKLAENLEQLVEVKGAFSHSNDFTEGDGLDPLELERYNELHSFSHQLQEITTDSYELIGQLQSQLDSVKILGIEQNKLNRDNQELVLRTRMVAVSTQASRFHRCVRQVCRLTEKNVKLTIIGDDILIDSRVLSELVDPIMHMLRNAVDHGIESADARVAAGKVEQGEVTLTFQRQGQSIVIHCRDDGPGLNFADIEHKAREKGLIPSEAKVEPAELQRLILRAGFSTRNNISQTSGRGIGLDVVQTKVQQLSGRLTVTSFENSGTDFTLTLPVTLLSTQALIVDADTHKLAVLSRGVDQIVYLTETDLIQVADQLTYQNEDKFFPVYPLSELTFDSWNLDPINGKQSAMLVTTGPNGNDCGLLVNHILASQDVVVKPLNRFTVKSEGVIGATISGEGAIYPVLDLNELLNASIDQYENRGARKLTVVDNREVDERSRIERPMALVVDDSLSARRSLAQFVSDMGMDVWTAKDGYEAIDLINEQVPVLILVDLEMPRMNGLELTEHVRARESTKNVPVIMITSRTTDKHRNLAAAAGVNNYISKPFSDDELLNLIQGQMAC